jgi:hypothetical protein
MKPTAFDRAVETTPLRLTFYSVLVTLAASTLFIDPRHGGTTQDWQFFQFFDEVARRTMLDYGQFPLWNPYMCGGNTMIGNPQTTWLAPTYPLILWFGTTLGQRLTQMTVIVVCCEGGYRLMRHFGVGPTAALLASVAYPLYGRTFSWIAWGQYACPAFCLVMWILYGYVRGLERPIYLALGGAFFAWMISFRGIQMGPQMAIGLGVWSLLQARRAWLDTHDLRKALWPIAACAIVGLFAFGFDAVRLVPVAQTLFAFPRIQPESVHRTVSEIFVEIFAIPPGTRGFDAPGYTYVGVITYLLFLGAVLFAAVRKRAAMALVVCLVFMLIGLGYQGAFSPYPLLKKLPLFSSLRNPYHWGFTAALFLVIAASFALDELERWLRSGGRARVWVGRILPPLLVLVTASELAWRGRAELTNPGWRAFTFPPIPRVEQDFRQTRANHWVSPMWPTVDRGMIACYDETPWPSSAAVRPDLPAEEYLADPSAGQVTRRKWTPNRIDLTVELSRPATVLVNQNWNSGWRASAGTVRSANGLLAVDLPAGRTELRLRFLPGSVLVGLLITLLAIGATVILWRRDRQRRRE